MFWVLLLTGGFMVVEAVGGWLAGSLALIADAGHMLSDTAALALAWTAFRVARRPHDDKRTYGYHRFEIVVAFVNGLALFAISAWIVVEAIGRLRAPVPVLGVPMLAVATAGLAVNLVALFVLRGGDRTNLNVRAALLHVMGDLLGSVGAIAAAIVVLATGWTPIDPILSIFLTLLILRAAWDVTRQAGARADGGDAGRFRRGGDAARPDGRGPWPHRRAPRARLDAQHRAVARHAARAARAGDRCEGGARGDQGSPEGTVRDRPLDGADRSRRLHRLT